MLTEVIPATPQQEPILANLLQLYIHDFSEFHDVQLGADGRFSYPDLPRYWREPDRHPFLIHTDGKLAGFTLVRKAPSASGSEMAWDLAEFFVLRAYRRQRVGLEAAQQVWRKFPGQWQVRVMESNRPAHHFWAHAVASFAGEAIPSVHSEHDGKYWQHFYFQSN